MVDERPHPRHASRRRREPPPELEGREDAFVMYFKERVYATFTGLAIVLVLAGTAEHHSPERALFALLIGVFGITMAGFVSDIIAHLAVHQTFPGRVDMFILLRIAGGALGTVVTPAILLALAWIGVLSLDGALHAASIVYVVTLAVIGWFAVRRSRLEWWKQVLTLLALVALGLAVVGIQTLAHTA